MSRLLSFVCCMLICTSIFANDVITLKDGQVIEGQVYRTLDNGDLCVHKLDGNDILVSSTDILTRTKNDKKFFVNYSGSEKSGPLGICLKLSYVHGFNSTSTNEYGSWDLPIITKMKNGNGFNLGLSYTLNFGRQFFLEPGINFTYLYYTLIKNDIFDDNTLHYPDKRKVDFYGWEVPLQIGYRLNMNKNCDLVFKVGPTFRMCWFAVNSSKAFSRLGVQADAGIEIKKSYIGIGFNLGLCAFAEDTDGYLGEYNNAYLKDTRNYLQLTYGYCF